VQRGLSSLNLVLVVVVVPTGLARIAPALESTSSQPASQPAVSLDGLPASFNNLLLSGAASRSPLRDISRRAGMPEPPRTAAAMFRACDSQHSEEQSSGLASPERQVILQICTLIHFRHE